MDKSSKSVLFYDLCRLCLENPGADDIFSKTDIVHDVFLCTGVNVPSQDNLPRKICFQCLEIVVKAKELRVLATANDKHLKSLFDDDETFTIGFYKTDQSQKEGGTISRKSSTDSDRTVKLEIVEHFDIEEVEEETQSKKRKASESPEHDSKSEDEKTISVRRDLFDSSGAVSKSEDATTISVRRDVVDSSGAVSKSEDATTISVRRDLFDSSGAVTSSTKDVVTSIKKNLKVKIKRIKTETGDSFYYVCDVCQKKFNAWKKFYLHQKTHNRNIMCPIDVCGKKFATKGDLEKHVRTHTGERPFSCDLCDKRFAQRGSLKSHKQTVHSLSGTPEKR